VGLGTPCYPDGATAACVSGYCGNGRCSPTGMSYIEAGTFMMGSPSGEPGRDGSDYTPRSTTIARNYFMDRTEVTQGAWKALSGGINPSGFTTSCSSTPDTCPVEQVNWYEAMEFCARLSAHTGVKFTLPSEAQWEYACRAGTTTAYHFGDTLGATQANCNGSETCPVGYYPANAFGLHDMHGQVWEWCLDDWHGSHEGAPTDGSAWVEKV
jgi:formylglycine-generating enzyme required for sulfatase activity